jgi:MmyB-like transcription regulator ligand binding domain
VRNADIADHRPRLGDRDRRQHRLPRPHALQHGVDARYAFLDPRSEGFYDDWDHVANGVVAILRSEAGRNPYDRDLTNLIGELGTKRPHHPNVGDLELTYKAMELSADTGLFMFAYTAEPCTESEQALQLLGSWAATPREPGIRATDHA